MSEVWSLFGLALLPALALGCLACARGTVAARIGAAQLLGTLAIVALLALSFAFDQASAIDLALALALLSPPAGLLVALFYERWL
ncbi:hypothetical protein GCM10011390_18600 [Aureimonas endophytica]|uniref:Multiple resistance and pH regulation protein F n=1 Tax=Aureimonas endophytica TaxID=2027858 RepID=A0A916ZJV4_9HYPH|nr:monovalent cation/H+ antiporter complex subunit F [Aureimonas endophytica]GGE00082.1 hypothetical protein GCM10011390_18600 [Aureimonas endophytica]